ncbi:MAG: phosphoribosyltransferase family protein [Patescibacteria group bacterium]
MYQTIRSPFAGLLELLFPLSCLSCSAEGAWLCSECEEQIPTILANHCPFCEAKTSFGNTCDSCKPRHALSGAISCIPYAHPVVQSLIHAWKYNSIAAVTPYLGRFVARSLVKARQLAALRTKQALESGISKPKLRQLLSAPALLSGLDVRLAPIPLHPKRERERGFNQAALLAAALASASSGCEHAHMLKRTKKTHAQAQLSGVDRSTNMSGAFSLDGSEREQTRGQHIVVIDDVITTGSTMEEAARLLKSAGALSVWGLTIAYGHPVHD